MGLLPTQLMPMDEDETYVKHVYFICIGWTLFVIIAAIALAILTL